MHTFAKEGRRWFAKSRSYIDGLCAGTFLWQVYNEPLPVARHLVLHRDHWRKSRPPGCTSKPHKRRTLFWQGKLFLLVWNWPAFVGDALGDALLHRTNELVVTRVSTHSWENIFLKILKGWISIACLDAAQLSLGPGPDVFLGCSLKVSSWKMKMHVAQIFACSEHFGKT